MSLTEIKAEIEKLTPSDLGALRAGFVRVFPVDPEIAREANELKR